ncbi:hypothetical protein DEO45_12495 [Rhodanobacter denitrificans]|uniref:Uncharacterized protein n=1 Tax=Rhodanobacter denitrificans TaxID=666685 RepID=A0A368KBL1_9GAMM|nr:hypothetical protein [Rhodanobacter denitrificans]RCS29312.1 hypothetical protein DEO45_12495 [Rhodanobacter denitrificans]
MSARGWQKALPWLALLAVALLATWLRYGVVESSATGQLCSGGGPWWCRWRQWLVLGFLNDAYGIAALAATALALLHRRAWPAWLAAALGVFALQLYCVESGALALLAGCLCLLRRQATRAAPFEQHRQGQQQVQAQP